jgi:hypothetical protein
MRGREREHGRGAGIARGADEPRGALLVEVPAADDDRRVPTLDEVDGVLGGLLDQKATVVVEEEDEGDAGAGEEGSGHGRKPYARIAP